MPLSGVLQRVTTVTRRNREESEWKRTVPAAGRQVPSLLQPGLVPHNSKAAGAWWHVQLGQTDMLGKLVYCFLVVMAPCWLGAVLCFEPWL